MKCDLKKLSTAIATAVIMSYPTAVTLSAEEIRQPEKLIILHTNDVHSQIDPHEDGTGGLLRRKAVIDSVRAEHPNVILIDAGDAVQGSMYFTLYKGEVEYKMMDLLDYDIAVLGNHDFDNGMEQLARVLPLANATWLTSNYDLRGSTLEPYFKPYEIRTVGDKKIGFIGINLEPKGMIAEGNYDGVVYLDATEAANAMAWYLKNVEHADYVVAVTHIGYDGTYRASDASIAKDSKNIDLIIGGHSHTVIDPENQTERYRARHANASCDSITIAQSGGKGAYVGEIEIDLATLATKSKLIKVDGRLDSRIDKKFEAQLLPYSHAVDSIMAVKVGKTAHKLSRDENELLNFLGDFVKKKGEELSGKKIDLSVINRGGVRSDLPKGKITKGMVIDMLPFNNRVEVLEIKGSDLKDAIDVVVKRGAKDGINSEARIAYDKDEKIATNVTFDGKELDPNAIYRVATIDYLANGGDYMEPLTRGTVVASSDQVLYDDLLDYIQKHFKKTYISATQESRYKASK